MRFFCLAVCCGLFFPALAAAQSADPPMRWAAVSAEQRLLPAVPYDTSASAVVLVNYAEVIFNPTTFHTTLFHHARVKLFDENGYEHATVRIPFLHDKQEVAEIEGLTHTTLPDGQVKRVALQSGDVFYERVNDRWTVATFTLPGLEPGAVVEYRYELRSDNPLYLRPWAFQSDIPVLYSEFRADVPPTLGFQTLLQGRDTYDIHEQQEYTISAGAYGGGAAGTGVRVRWGFRDLPALYDEPYMTARSDYLVQLRLLLMSYFHPRRGTVPFLESWEDLAKDLRGDKLFGKQAKAPKDLRREVDALLTGNYTAEYALQKIYDHVRTSYAWNGRYSRFSEQGTKRIAVAKGGNSGELVLLLVAALRHVGLDANPVFVSTRDNGRVVESFPDLDQFNRVLAHVAVDGQTFLLDPTDPARPYDVPPPEALNGRGWLVAKTPRFVTLESDIRHARTTTVTGRLSADGTITGRLQYEDSGFAALKTRRQLHTADTPEVGVRERVLASYPTANLGAPTIEHLDALRLPVRTSADLTLANAASTTGDRLYLPAVLFERLLENPFTRETRTFDIDYTYPRTQRFELELTLPNGYTVEELPAPVVRRSANRAVEFQQRATVEDGVLHMVSELQVNVRSIAAKHYDALRRFYAAVVDAQAEQIVLTKTSSTEASGSEEGGR